MPRPRTPQEELPFARIAADQATTAARGAALTVAKKAAQVDVLRRSGDPKLKQAERDLSKLVSLYGTKVRAATEATNKVFLVQKQWSLMLADPFAQIPAKRPLLFLPVRLETRFKRPAGKLELLVRVYPDTIHSDTFERELTNSEAEWGSAFWETTSAAEKDDPQQRGAWAKLVGRYGPRRAAWIARATDPQGGVSVGSRVGSWTRAPQTRVLPDRWAVIAYTGGNRVLQWGGVVPDMLPTGPSPTAPDAVSGTGLPQVDEGMKWMVEFAAAESVGMGIRVPLAPGTSQIDRLLVFGVKWSADAAESRTRLEALLDAHHYSDGLGFVPPGTPTNNTEEADAGFRSHEALADASYALERGSALAAANDGSDAAVLAKALDVDVSVFAHVPGANGVTQIDAEAMNAALWPATWQYHLSQLMAPATPPGASTFKATDIALGFSHFVTYVRGPGPLPALRAGRQPYGVLPVTSLDRFVGPTSATALETKLAPFLRQLRDKFWRSSFVGAPRMGRTGNVDQDLVEVLGQSALSQRYTGSWFAGLDYTLNMALFTGLNAAYTNIWTAIIRALSELALKALGVTWQPKLLDLVQWQWKDLDGPHVDGAAASLLAESLSGTDGLSANYITWLLGGRSTLELRDEIANGAPPPDTPPNALLYLLLRHSILRALAGVAEGYVQSMSGTGTKSLWTEPELVGVDPAKPTKTIWTLFDKAPQNTVKAPWKVAEDTFHGVPIIVPQGSLWQLRARELRKLTASLNHLEHRPTAILDRLMAETLDLASFRLDAWITSLATKRLATLRDSGEKGIRLAGYGWLENIVPVTGSALPEPAATAQPVVDASNRGYVHAPSLGQAAAAAVLRAGYLSHAGTADNPLAIDLSSRRVRLAHSLLDGVRQGQPLGALLGYRFERGLHDRSKGTSLELDQFIYPFRLVAPLVAGKAGTDPGAVEALGARNVVDGLRLLELRESGKLYETTELAAATQTQRGEIEKELALLADALDAVADSVVAESVYQIVQGNPERAGAAVDAIAAGDVPPPELQAMRTPRSGIGVTHRLLIFLGDAAPAVLDPNEWPGRGREDAEPALAAWAADYLGSLDDVFCTAYYNLPDDQRPLQRTFPVSRLGISPLDVVYMVAPTEEGQPTEFEQRLVGFARGIRGAPPGADIRIRYNVLGPSATAITIEQLLELARSARELLTAARPADARDLVLPQEADAVGAQIDSDDLAGRAARAFERLKLIRGRIDPDDDLQTLHDAILAASSLGVPGAVPVAPGPPGSEREPLEAQARAVLEELDRRIEAAGASTLDPIEQIARVFGRGFKVVPRFSVPAANATEISAAFQAASTAGLDGDARTWFTRVARIRERAARLETVQLYRAALAHGSAPRSFAVAQLAHGSEEWVGRKPTNGRVAAGRVSIVAPGTVPAITATGSHAGLVVDEWTEVVPSETESTGVTFQFESAGAEPPQALLLAVHPDLAKLSSGSWDLETVEAILLETLDLAELRAVDLQTSGMSVGQFLPATYLAFNLDDDTVSTDLSRNAIGGI